jgi:hypothetical protein
VICDQVFGVPGNRVACSIDYVVDRDMRFALSYACYERAYQ